MLIKDVLTANGAVDQGDGRYIISGDGWSIEVLKDAPYPATGSVWEWRVAGQFFSRDDWAAEYLTKLIAEKVTGERVLDHERGSVPDICGTEEYVSNHSCRAKMRGVFSMLCQYCPVAEQIEADRDGVTLKYVQSGGDK